jgi:transposase
VNELERHQKEVPGLLRSTEVNQIEEMKRQGLSVTAIAEVTGYDRKTVRKYLARPDLEPRYKPRPGRPTLLDAFQTQIDERLSAGVWNAVVLTRELKEIGYKGGYSTVKEYLQPKREAARTAAVRRFETPAGRQAQVDWGHLGTVTVNGERHRVSGFTFTLGYSRMMMAEAALDQKLGTLLRLHEEAFRQLGGVPEEILYDRMKTVWVTVDDRGEIVWNPLFLDFARYWGFTPRLCKAYRAQTKGKVESGVKYVRRNFLCGLLGKEPSSLEELNAQMKVWVWNVANERVHGTTHEQPVKRWESERAKLHPMGNRPPYPYAEDEPRRVARDAYVAWQGSRYSVPWQYAGKDVWVCEHAGRVEIYHGAERIAVHDRAARHQVVTYSEHHRGIPLGGQSRGEKILIHLREAAPVVEARSLAAYESVADGGAR